MSLAHSGQTWQSWQTWITLAIGLLALAYLVRRWWPRRGAAHLAQGGTHCGTGTPTASGSALASSACQSCSGGCGSGPPAVRGEPRVPGV
ncbi:hypothetical protein [uncultured Aquabacterium sp.]|uniref:hypothetical protein n=1 Tax=Aquabacterium commune TaxID=70586 RepID=UPI0030D1051A